MKEFQALGLDVSIVNDEGNTLQLKEIEDQEDKEDNRVTIDEIDSPATEIIDEPPVEDEMLEEEENLLEEDLDFDDFDEEEEADI